MKKTALTFLKVAKILDIIAIVLFALMFVLFVVAAVENAILLKENAANGVSEADLAITAAAVGLFIGYAVTCAIMIPCCVVGLIFAKKAALTLKTAKSKEEAKKMAIASIVTGALSTGFAIVAGILMLCMKDEHYADNVVVEEAK